MKPAGDFSEKKYQPAENEEISQTLKYFGQILKTYKTSFGFFLVKIQPYFLKKPFIYQNGFYRFSISYYISQEEYILKNELTKFNKKC